MDPLSDVLSLLKLRSYVSGGFDAGGNGQSSSPGTKASNATLWFPASAGCWWRGFPTRYA